LDHWDNVSTVGRDKAMIKEYIKKLGERRPKDGTVSIVLKRLCCHL